MFWHEKSAPSIIPPIATLIIGLGVGLLTGDIMAWALIGLGFGLFAESWLSHSSR